MRRIFALVSAAFAAPLSATTPPPSVPFAEQVCRAESVVVGTASKFKVVGAPGCNASKSEKFLAMCQEVEVLVSVQEVLRSGTPALPSTLKFRFGGGFFSVDQLRSDLLSGSRYFFLSAPSGGKSPVFRTSYPWLLGAENSVESRAEVLQALESCPSPNNSFKPTPPRGPA